jgi:CHASE2 domain-containing sensor protein
MRRLVSWVGEDMAGHPVRLGKSMSLALAQAHGESEHNEKWYVQELERLGAIERTRREPLGHGVVVEEYLVDFSPLSFLLDPANRLVVPKARFNESAGLRNFAEDVRDRLKGKLVLIGYAKQGRAVDYFTVPDREEPVPGVLVQACGVYTLTVAPLFELTGWARVATDILLSLLIFGTVALVRLYFVNERHWTVATHRLEIILISLAILTVAGSALLIHYTRVMWDDFLIVIIVLLFHSPLERFCDHFWPWARVVAPRFFRYLIFRPKSRNR